MTPAYKEALKNKDKPLFKERKKKEAKHLGYSLSSMVLWLFSILHTTLDFQLILLVFIAVFLTYYLWSWKLAIFTLLLSLGFHLSEGTLHFIFMGILLFTILFTFLASLGSISNREGSQNRGTSFDDNFIEFEGDIGESSSDGD